ncbi:MFS transporter [Paenibacillus sp. NPDC057967]|uniref:MFS transporter n=1 Tax=Paenibacillus sp. NPDC057967 TaxID=3346293 RepID=UPI0036DA9947
MGMRTELSKEGKLGIWKVLTWLLVFEFFFVFNNNVFNLISPKLVDEFKVAPSTVSLVISMGTLAFGVCSIVYTILADRISMRRILLVTCATFPIISVLGVFSVYHFTLLILFRVLFGMSIAAPVALAVIIALRYFNKLEAAKLFGFIGAIFQLGAAFGNALGGYITEHLSWNYIFLFSCITIFSIPTIYRHMPQEKSRQHSFDYAGVVMLTGVVTLIILFFTFKMQYLWMLGAAIVLGFIFVLYSNKKKDPFVDLRVLGIKGVSGSLLVCLIFYMTQAAFLFIFPFIVRDTYGMSLSVIGMFNMFTNILAFATGMFSGRIIKAIGYRNMVILGGGFIFTGLLVVALFVGFSVVPVFIGLGVFNIGYVLFFSGYLSNYTQLLPSQFHGAGVGIEKLVVQLGSSIGAAFIGMFFGASFMSKALVDFSGRAEAAPFSNMSVILLVLIVAATSMFLFIFKKNVKPQEALIKQA